jgi:hypothetical protein
MSDKFGPKSDKYFFIGYPSVTKSYYFYHRSNNKVFVARHDVFLEEEFLSKELYDILGQTEVEQVSSEAVEQVQQTPRVRRSGKVVHAPERYFRLYEILLVGDINPLTYYEVISREDSEEWLEAIKSELQSMKDNQV